MLKKGTCADIMKNVTKDEPGIAPPYIDNMIKYVNYKAPRVKWGISELVGNMAKAFQYKVEVAIPKLLKNTKDDGTVVRWCAAYALSEIAKWNEEIRGELVPRIEEILSREKNTGVRNVYFRVLKTISTKT